MTTLMIQLQAAIGLGITLNALALVVLVVIFPLVWIVTTVQAISNRQKAGYSLDWKTYSYAIVRGFVFGLLTVLITASLIYIWALYFVDLSIS